MYVEIELLKKSYFKKYLIKDLYFETFRLPLRSFFINVFLDGRKTVKH